MMINLRISHFSHSPIIGNVSQSRRAGTVLLWLFLPLHYFGSPWLLLISSILAHIQNLATYLCDCSNLKLLLLTCSSSFCNCIIQIKLVGKDQSYTTLNLNLITTVRLILLPQQLPDHFRSWDYTVYKDHDQRLSEHLIFYLIQNLHVM